MGLSHPKSHILKIRGLKFQSLTAVCLIIWPKYSYKFTKRLYYTIPRKIYSDLQITYYRFLIKSQGIASPNSEGLFFLRVECLIPVLFLLAWLELFASPGLDSEVAFSFPPLTCLSLISVDTAVAGSAVSNSDGKLLPSSVFVWPRSFCGIVESNICSWTLFPTPFFVLCLKA